MASSGYFHVSLLTFAVIAMQEFDEIAPFYDVMYSDRHDDLMMYHDFVRQFGGPVLECGCGTGRILFSIAETGIEIWGIDSSEKMLTAARVKVQNLCTEIKQKIRLSQQDMRNFQIDHFFKLCIVPFRAFLHMLTADDQNRALSQINRHLEKDGYLIIDIFAPSHELLAKQTTTIRFDQKVNCETGKSSLSPIKSLMSMLNSFCMWSGITRRWVIKTLPIAKSCLSPSAIFSDMKCRRFLKKMASKLKAVFGHFDKRPYDYKSGEMIFVAQKEG